MVTSSKVKYVVIKSAIIFFIFLTMRNISTTEAQSSLDQTINCEHSSSAPQDVEYV